MSIVCYEDTIKYQKDYTLVFVSRKIYADVVTPIQLLQKLSTLDKQYYLLGNVKGGEKWGHYSFLGFQPLLQVICKNGIVTMKSGKIQAIMRGLFFFIQRVSRIFFGTGTMADRKAG